MGEGFEQSEHRSSCSASLDFTEDATSLPTDSSRLTQQVERNGPLYDLSSLMAQLPVKRGLSKFYQGKSQSFTSLSNVLCVEDLVKKECHFRRMKPRRVGAEAVKQSSYVPGPFGRIISKKFSRRSCSSLVSRKSGSNSSSLLCAREPPMYVDRNL